MFRTYVTRTVNGCVADNKALKSFAAHYPPNDQSPAGDANDGDESTSSCTSLRDSDTQSTGNSARVRRYSITRANVVWDWSDSDSTRSPAVAEGPRERAVG